jgi:H+/Cl- antiporter ClcA
VPKPAAPPELSSEDVSAAMRSKPFLGLLALVAVVGVVVSLATWCFLELVHQLQSELFTHLPHALGYEQGPPLWWSLPVLVIGALITALAIERLPGTGGHIPAEGLEAGAPTAPRELPGVALAGLATIGFGLVLGPEAPLIAIGGATALLMVGLAKPDTPPPARMVVAAAGSFSALSFIFTSPLIAAVILIEATALGGPRMRLVLVPGLLAAGIGTLLSVGIGSFTGLSTSAYALGRLDLSPFGHPTLAQFGWTMALALVVAALACAMVKAGQVTYRLVSKRLLLVAPAVALVVGGLAIAFSQAADHPVDQVLFSGQSALPGLVAQPGAWSVSALLLLILFKGAAYSLCLGSFRGGPIFPALFLGAAAGLVASHLPGFPVTPAVAVGMGAAAVAVLRLPLSAVVLATLLTSGAGVGVEPLVIVGVVVSYIATLVLFKPREQPAPRGSASMGRA